MNLRTILSGVTESDKNYALSGMARSEDLHRVQIQLEQLT
jgi:hypothetical protein